MLKAGLQAQEEDLLDADLHAMVAILTGTASGETHR